MNSECLAFSSTSLLAIVPPFASVIWRSWSPADSFPPQTRSGESGPHPSTSLTLLRSTSQSKHEQSKTWWNEMFHRSHSSVKFQEIWKLPHSDSGLFWESLGLRERFVPGSFQLNHRKVFQIPDKWWKFLQLTSGCVHLKIPTSTNATRKKEQGEKYSTLQSKCLHTHTHTRTQKQKHIIKS